MHSAIAFFVVGLIIGFLSGKLHLDMYVLVFSLGFLIVKAIWRN